MEISGYIATIVGTAAGIIALFYTVSGWPKRAIAFIAILLVSASAYYMAGVTNKLGEMESTFRQAKALIADRDMKHTHQGFVLAALAFLEAKKDQFPDTYQRALVICEKYGCDSPDRELQDGFNSVEAASILESIIEGIAVMSGS